MRTRIQQHQSWAVLILAFFVLALGGGEIQAQTDSSCNREGSSRSAQTTQAAKLTLTNQTNETLTVYWLDFEGKRQKWFDLSAGQAFEQSTFVGHLWLVAKPNGQCLAIYSAPGNFVIGKPQSPVNTNRPTQSQNQTNVQPISDAAIEKSWTEFFTAFQKAVKQRDRASLKRMISSDWQVLTDDGLVKATPDQVVKVTDEDEWKALESSLATGIKIGKSSKTKRGTADCHHDFALEADGKWRWVLACFEFVECDCDEPTTPVNKTRPTQSQNQTNVQPNTSAGGGTQTGNAVLTVSSQPGAANPLAVAGLALFKQSFGEDLRRKGQVPAGSSAKLTPLEFWVRSCLTPTGNCRQAMIEMRANSVADIMLDADGKATLPGVPPGAYYVYVIARAVPPRAWEQSVELKPGANSVTLDPRNMASLDTILSGGRTPSDVAAKPPSTDKPANTPPNTPTGGSAEAYYAQGAKYIEAKEFAKAIEVLKKAVSLKPSLWDAHFGIGHSYYNLKKFSEALPPLNEAARQKPNQYIIHYWIGMSHKGILEDSVRRNIITKEDHAELAAAAFEKAVRLKPDDIESQYQLGFVYHVMDENEKAVKAFNAVIRLKPNDVDAHYHLGGAYVGLGKRNEALQVYRKLLTLNKERAQKLYAEINKPK
ncbi:MAG: tetratricopeptide repeat protein [Pyrinomonadaceae bacterium]